VDFQPRPAPAPPDWGVDPAPGFGDRLWRFVSELLHTVAVSAVIFLAVNLVTARIRVEGSSMEPTLHDGELVVVSRLAYRWGTPQRGDIVVFRFPLDPERRFIKRVIGLPGEDVVIRDGVVTVDGVPLDEPYIAAAPRYSGEWELSADEVFVLGDNRNNSQDSQTWGPVPLSHLIGKAVVVYWPPPEIGLIPHNGRTVEASG